LAPLYHSQTNSTGPLGQAEGESQKLIKKLLPTRSELVVLRYTADADCSLLTDYLSNRLSDIFSPHSLWKLTL
jgi:hypothetical protein